MGTILSDLGFSFQKDEVEALEMFLDVDSDGSLSFDEFFQYWIKVASTNELDVLQQRLDLMTQAANIFKTYDTNKNRVLMSLKSSTRHSMNHERMLECKKLVKP